MTRPVRITFPAASTTAVTTAQTLGAAGNFVLDGSLLSGVSYVGNTPGISFPGVLRTVSVTVAADESARTFTVTGYAYGALVTESLTGPASGTAYTTELFGSVVSISSDGATAGAVSWGSGTTGITNPIRIDDFIAPSNTTVNVEITTTANVTVQNTVDPLNDTGFDISTAKWIDHPTLASLTTGNNQSNYDFPPRWVRGKMNSSSGSGAFTMTVIQAGY